MLHEQNLPESDPTLTPTFGARRLEGSIPKYTLPDSPMEPRNAYQVVHDELMLDGNARLNMATFVTTWMEPEARQLMAETFEKNMIDKDEYPQTAEIEQRCVSILADLYHAGATGEKACGCSTTGSSEAAMLAGMALKWRWRQRRQAASEPLGTPNLIMGTDVQICWEKFCRYWEIEPRLIPMQPGKYGIAPEEVVARCDENTIGVVAILGTTFTGQYEPIAAINDTLETYNTKTGHDVPLHIDAASGGFVAPFLQPELPWDFRLKWVKSINVSGHKYGLVYPGVGWAIWRSWEELPDELVFHVNYLGGDMPTFALNFSRPGNQVVAQYYNFLRLGREGYRKVLQACQDVAAYLARQIEAIGPFECLTHGEDIPVLAFRIKDTAEVNFNVFDLSAHLRQRGWQVPAYSLPADCEDIAVLRIVVREGTSRDMAEMLLADLKRAIGKLQSLPADRQTASASSKGKPRC